MNDAEYIIAIADINDLLLYLWSTNVLYISYVRKKYDALS